MAAATGPHDGGAKRWRMAATGPSMVALRRNRYAGIQQEWVRRLPVGLSGQDIAVHAKVTAVQQQSGFSGCD